MFKNIWSKVNFLTYKHFRDNMIAKSFSNWYNNGIKYIAIDGTIYLQHAYAK